MIRFLNLKNQICDEVADFAFFDTVSDCIIRFDGEQTFNSLESFKDYHATSGYDRDGSCYPLDRFIGLIPENFFDE